MQLTGMVVPGEEASGSWEKTGNKEKELGKYLFTLRGKQPFPMLYKSPASQEEAATCQYSQATCQAEQERMFLLSGGLKEGAQNPCN